MKQKTDNISAPVMWCLCLALYFTFDAANFSKPWVIVDIYNLQCGGDLFATKAKYRAV